MKQLRLGEIKFINALPLLLSYPSLAGVAVHKTSLAPTGLNQAMVSGDLDVSPVSSACYLRNKAKFVMLEGISISAEQPVESVLLFLPKGFEGLTEDSIIAVPDSSETSVALMEYVIFRHTGLKLKNHLTVYPVGHGAAQLESGHPILAIGDEALTLKTQFPKDKVFYLDLAEAWQAETQHPFVFAVWVAQKSWAEKFPEHFSLMNQLLVTQKNMFLTDHAVQSRIINEAQRRCPQLPQQLLRRYFTGALSYNLDESHLVALSRFEAILKWLDNDTENLSDWDRSELSVQLLHR